MSDYGYESDVSITSTIDILKRIPQEDIYEFILGYKPTANLYVKSPIRDDDDAGAWYEWSNGVLMFKDFADPERVIRDCFQMLMDREGISLRDAIKIISDHFQASTLPIIYPEFTITKRKGNHIQRSVSSLTEQIDTEITFKARQFSERDRLFWNQRYEITRQQLISDEVFPIIWYRFYSQKKKEWIIIRPFNVAYAITGFSNPEKVKIYVPFSPNKKGKFITNCNGNDIGGYNRLPISGEQIVIAKSYKDWRVLTNQGVVAIWFQNEVIIPTKDIIDDLSSRFTEIVLLYDNDETGTKTALRIKSLFDENYPNKARCVFISNHLAKDPSDLIHHHKKQSLINFLNINHIGNTSSNNSPFLGSSSNPFI